MNLNISYNWLKEYVKLTDKPAEFAKKISLAGPSVDHITDFGDMLSGVVVGKIIEIQKHPNADKLFVGKIDIGQKIIQLVFGTMAVVKVGQQLPVAVAPTVLPTGQKIEKSNLRGINSEGMLCLNSELGISNEDKIFFIDEKIKPGTPLVKALKYLNDQIFDIEVTSNRPDAMCIVGIAREAAAITNNKFLYQEPKPNLIIRDSAKKLTVTIKEPGLCPRYEAVVMTGVKVEASPLWMQQRLLSAGLRPINNLVDITNYVLLEFGQPMHVFDYNKLENHEIVVRLAKKDERILALDGQEYELNEKVLIVADAEKPCAVGGIMGGELSGATAATKNIVLEVGNWEPTNIRRTTRSLSLYSDSSNLYEKGLHPEGTHPALLRAIELVKELAGGQLASEIIDKNNSKFKAKEIKLNPEQITRILGVEIKPAEIKKYLELLGFAVKSKIKGELEVSVPWWRDRDIEGEHDLIEEVARLYGYHRLPTQLMAGELPVDFTATDDFQLEDRVKDILVGFGATEIFSYSFISEQSLTNTGLDPLNAVRIANPLSLDLEYLRTSLVPGLLQIISENAAFYDQLKLFDLSKVYLKHEGNLPEEKIFLALACVAASPEEALADLRGLWEGLSIKLGLNYQFTDFKKRETYWSDDSIAIKGEEVIGGLGLVAKTVTTKFGIKKAVAIAYVDFETLLKNSNLNPSYTAISKYPSIDLDISLEIADNISFGQVQETVAQVDREMIKNISFLSVFKGQGIAKDKKALAIRVTYRHDDKTLTLAEAQTVHDKVVDRLKKEYNVTIR